MSVVLPYPLPAACMPSEPAIVLCGDVYQREYMPIGSLMRS